MIITDNLYVDLYFLCWKTLHILQIFSLRGEIISKLVTMLMIALFFRVDRPIHRGREGNGIWINDGAALVVDQTGVSAPVVDMFRQAGLKPVGIYIHGSDKITHDGATYRFPKRDLVGVLQVLLQNRRLKIASGPLSDTLASEL